MNTLGNRLKAARESKKLGQKEVERITGISFKTLSNYENNRSEPDVEKLSLLCKAYEMPADYFIDSNYEAEHTPNFFLHLYEQEIIKKYRALDGHGKDVTDYVLNSEYNRSMASGQLDVREEHADYNIIPGRFSIYKVSAGRGAYLGPEAFEIKMIQKNDLTQHALFMVQVAGDSMEPTYHNDDVLIVEKAETLIPGEIGVFTVDGEGFVKQFGGRTLISLNTDYKPIPISDNSQLNGRVIGILDPDWIVG